jgi:hypothetical protein
MGHSRCGKGYLEPMRLPGFRLNLSEKRARKIPLLKYSDHADAIVVFIVSCFRHLQ